MTKKHQGFDIAALIDRYCQVWNEHDLESKVALLSLIWADNATYTDPTIHTAGSIELISHISKVQARRPGGKVVRTSKIDTHHDFARFSWQIILSDGSRLPEGLDLVFFSSDGKKIERIIGFFGQLVAI